MSLFRQMALAIALIIIVLLSAVMILNFQSSKKDMIENLYQTTVNNIASLSNQLANAGDEQVLIQSVIDAEYDSGYFQKISFTSNDGSFIYIQEDKDPIEDIPSWFIQLTPVHLKSVQEDVSSGWNIIGVVSVDGDTRIVYKALYKMFLQLFYIFVVSVLSSLVILSILLSFILKPLKGVQKQADAIMRNEFIMQEKIPYTKEFKDVVLGMNSMVVKLKAIFDKGNEELRMQKEHEYTDQITQLKNRKYLIDKLPEYLKIDAASKGGVSIMVAISGVIEANEKIGHQKVDKLFVQIAELFAKSVSHYPSAIVTRINGTEFLLFIPDCQTDDALKLAKDISTHSKEKITTMDLSPKTTFLSLGIYQYNYQESIANVLSQSDNALSQAKFSHDKIYLATPSTITEVMGKDAWRTLLLDVIKNEKISFDSWDVVDTKKGALVHKALSLSILADKQYSYGQFMAPANQVGLSNEIYETVLNILFKNPPKELNNTLCSLRLPYEFLILENTYHFMSNLLNKYTKKQPLQLIIEMPDKLISQDTQRVQEYKNLLEKFNIDIGVYEFIGESKDYNYLQILRPSYIKASSEYFLSQTEHSIATLKLITQSLNIRLIANGVMDIEDLNSLQAKEIYTIQGKVAESLANF